MLSLRQHPTTFTINCPRRSTSPLFLFWITRWWFMWSPRRTPSLSFQASFKPFLYLSLSPSDVLDSRGLLFPIPNLLLLLFSLIENPFSSSLRRPSDDLNLFFPYTSTLWFHLYHWYWTSLPSSSFEPPTTLNLPSSTQILLSLPLSPLCSHQSIPYTLLPFLLCSVHFKWTATTPPLPLLPIPLLPLLSFFYKWCSPPLYWFLSIHHSSSNALLYHQTTRPPQVLSLFLPPELGFSSLSSSWHLSSIQHSSLRTGSNPPTNSKGSLLLHPPSPTAMPRLWSSRMPLFLYWSPLVPNPWRSSRRLLLQRTPQ